MADVQVFKTKISNTCVLLRSSEAQLNKLEQPFEFPTEKSKCEEYIREKTANLNYLSREISQGKQLLDKHVKDAIERIDKRVEPKEQEKLMLDLNRLLEDGTNNLEIKTIQWLNKIEFRLEELTQQSTLISHTPSRASQQAAGSLNHDTCSEVRDRLTHDDRNTRIRRPLLEVPTFSGDFREFNTFWSVFETLIHKDSGISDQEKFLFLKQALKGKAASSISSIPVIGEKYCIAVNILKKQYDKSESMADILISEIECIPRANDNPRSCRDTLSAISSRVVHLEQTGVSLNADRVWRRLILSKFTDHICSTVIRKENDADFTFHVKDIMEVIDDIIALQETTELTTGTLFGNDNQRASNSTRLNLIRASRLPTQHVANRKTCLCGQAHSPQFCDRFSTPDARRIEARRQGVCWRCLDKSHNSKFCKNVGKCPKCNGDHHSSLCIRTSAAHSGRRHNQPQTSAHQPPETSLALHRSDRSTIHPQRSDRYSRDNNRVQALSNSVPKRPLVGQYVLQMASALIFNEARSEYQPVTILLDSGAQRSFIKAKLERLLNLPTVSATSFTTTGMGELQESFKSNELRITLKGHEDRVKLHQLLVFTKDKLTTTTRTAELSAEDKKFIKKNKLTIAQRGLTSREVSPDILIGQDLLSKVIDHAAQTIKLPSGLLLTPTIFGYTVSGATDLLANPTKNGTAQCDSLIVASPSLTSRDDYKMNIKHLYELESLGIHTKSDTDEASIVKFMDSYRGTITIENGSITAGFPFTDDIKNLKDNFNVAVRRLQSLCRVLQGDSEKFKLYDNTITSYLQEGIIEEAKDDNGIATFYLPHRHVWTPSKSTKLRVVFDASSHARDELSLNNVIYGGHSLTPLIHEVLLKFRTHLYTMVADIQKAFLQIRLPTNHRDVTRFLWVKNVSLPATGNNLRYLRFCRVPFGINASPAILNQCILKHIEASNSTLSEELSSSLYVDNVFLEGSNTEELLQKYAESKKLFASAGMNLRDYLSNSECVNEHIPDYDRAASSDIKVLGIQWNSIRDTISLKCVEKQAAKVSKRTVLSQINAYCFDPLGLLTPLLIPAKIFLQDLNKKKYGWDASLSNDDEANWKSLHSKIYGFGITLPRKVIEKDNSTRHTLSIFVDSSKRAYACSLYITTISCRNKKDSRLFTAKSKIAPINKEQTIPRLELLSIFIGLSLAESTTRNINMKPEHINLFSDSTIALCWIQGNRRLPLLVSTLVQKICAIVKRLRESSDLTFFHVPTDQNVADSATRGVTKDDLVKHRWWNGPKWLNQPSENWPVKEAKDLCQQDADFDSKASLYVSNTEEDSVTPIWPTEKISSYPKLVRIVAYCARFIRNTTKGRQLALSKGGVQTTSPSAEEASMAERLIIRQEQFVFKSEILLQDKQLNVRIDEEGIYRRLGRLLNAELPFSAVNPIHIPKQSKLGSLIAMDLHRTLVHCGSNQLLYNIRRRFWIPRDRDLCRRTLKNCSICRKANASPYKYPNVGPLPMERVTESPPFSYTGVDFMGPITTKSTSGEDCKRYVALFTCLVTRLVHLEVALDMSAKSFMYVFKRFIARRGVPKKILSDNGTNFKLAESLLRQNQVLEEATSLSSFLANHRIHWTFIPPSSPWMGGVWERMVGTVKKSFHKTVGRRKLTDELLHTTLCEIESVVNSRPLTTIGDRDSLHNPLRPIDFIYKDVRHGTTQLTVDEDNDDPDFRSYPELSSHKAAKNAISETEKITRKFWTIWRNEYLMELRDRHKMAGRIARTSSHPPKIGDVVLLDDDSQQPRGQWPMAVIMDLVASRDNAIRSAMVQTASGKLIQRPINRLIPLEIQSSIEPSNMSIDDTITTPADETETEAELRVESRKPALVTVRKQPARAAKNTGSYKENVLAVKKGCKSATSSALLMLATCIFTVFGLDTTSAASISCTNKGIRINNNSPSAAELCVNRKHCITFSAGIMDQEVPPPLKYIINRHTVQWRTIIDTKQHVDVIECPARDVCASITCMACLDLLANPHCAPQIAISMMAVILLLITIPLSATCCLAARWKKSKKTLLQKRTINSPSLTQIRDNSLATNMSVAMPSSKMVTFAILTIWVVRSMDACQYTHTINVNNTVCEQSNILFNCRKVLESTMTLSERRPQACFRIRNGNKTVGSVKVRLQNIMVFCNPVVLFYTRDVDIITESAKRCDLAGSCNSQACSHVNKTSAIQELRDTYNFPGVTRCTTSCGGIPCGCLLPMPGCLFSRTYAKPKSRIIYQVFHCPTWLESAQLEYTYTATQGEKNSESVAIITQATRPLSNANITLEFIAMSAIPLLSSTFVRTFHVDSSEVAIINSEDFFALRCPTWKSSKNITECYVEDNCSCSPSETDANCVCKNLDLRGRMTSLQNRLPLSSSVLHLRDDHGRVCGIIHDAVADITISTLIGLQYDSIVDNERCSVKASSLKGCYNCLSGAEVTFSCHAKRPIMVEIKCYRKMFAASCNSTTARTTVTIHSTMARYNESCVVKCGDRTHNITLFGILAFHPQWKVSVIPSNKHANYVSVFNYPDFGHALDVALHNWKTSVIAFIAVAVLIVASIWIIPRILLQLIC